jgi:hypothetical protein
MNISFRQSLALTVVGGRRRYGRLGCNGPASAPARQCNSALVPGRREHARCRAPPVCDRSLPWLAEPAAQAEAWCASTTWAHRYHRQGRKRGASIPAVRQDATVGRQVPRYRNVITSPRPPTLSTEPFAGYPPISDAPRPEAHFVFAGEAEVLKKPPGAE